MRAYVTGAAGFVGTWLVRHLSAMGDDVVAVDAEVDVTSETSVRDSLVASRPQVVYHLAGLAHVGKSWSEPAATFSVNALGTLNLLEAAAACATPPRVLVVSSAEVYGLAGSEPIAEDAALAPVTPYAASKVAAEFLAIQAFLGRHLGVIRVRPFNHVGPGQGPQFVLAALARRIVEAELGGGGEVPVGNLSARRDFTDVRDVVVAYRLLAERGEDGAVYNVASGRAVKIGDVASELVALARAPVELSHDPSLDRAVDVPVFLGDASRLRETTSWEPAIPFEKTLADVMEHWRERLGLPA